MLISRRYVMKFTTVIAVAALALSTIGTVSAQEAPAGKTRAEVRAELVQAEAQGLLPTGRNDYPPSAATINQNRALYAARHPGTDSVAAKPPAQAYGNP
jgi:hypothetical protein